MINEHVRKYCISLQFGFVIDLWVWNDQHRLVVNLSRIVRGNLILFIKFDSNNETPVTQQPVQQGIQSTGENTDSESSDSSYPESLPDLVPIPID